MHRVHHSIVIAEQNTNFGFNVSWWDRLFGHRAAPSTPHESMPIGLADWRSPDTASVRALFSDPVSLYCDMQAPL